VRVIKDGKVAEGGGYSGSIAGALTRSRMRRTIPAAAAWVAVGYVGYWLDDDGEPACSAEYPHGMPRYQTAPGYRLEVFLDARPRRSPSTRSRRSEGWQAVRSPWLIDLGERPA
jgi:hypothetical protein